LLGHYHPQSHTAIFHFLKQISVRINDARNNKPTFFRIDRLNFEVWYQGLANTPAIFEGKKEIDEPSRGVTEIET